MAERDDAALRSLAEAVADRFCAAGRTVATAESCSGGWIAKACTDLAGSSRWFLGGVVAYANEVKIRVLGVDSTLLEREGAVSEGVVRAMAQGALERLGADASVAVSGVAGPGGGSLAKPVGTVWFAWAQRREGRAVSLTTACHHLPGDREAVRRATVGIALQGLLRE